MRIKDTSKENIRGECFQKSGASSLSDDKLLAIILQKETKQKFHHNIINYSFMNLLTRAPSVQEFLQDVVFLPHSVPSLHRGLLVVLDHSILWLVG